MVVIVGLSTVVFARSVEAGWDAVRAPRVALASYLAAPNASGLSNADACATRPPRMLSIDAAGFKYFTGLPGVVTPDDPIETIQAVAQAYGICWLVVERADAASALGPVLRGVRPSWIGAPVFTVAAADGGLPELALFPVCVTSADLRCGG